ncbi:MAG TPA: sigma 54-interacting transcriptional regulator [Candidatus Babeliales bacterium]|nr:sigma 54-interacting transcriptional regulator [Candidatus Babeliales bacterium]
MFTVTTLFFILKIYIIARLVSQRFAKTYLHRSWILLILVLIGSATSDLTWIFYLVRNLWVPSIPYPAYLCILRIAWGMTAVQYQSLTLFLESLVDQSTHLSPRQKIFTFISCCFLLWTIIIACIDFNCSIPTDRMPIEFLIRQVEIIYLSYILIPSTICVIIWKTYNSTLPRILKQQIKVLLPAIIIPLWISDMLQITPFSNLIPLWVTNSIASVCLSNIFLIGAIHYCTRRMISLRFLNLRGHVESKKKFSFVDGFKLILEQLSRATTHAELRHITQTLFKEAFNTPLHKTMLYIRQSKKQVPIESIVQTETDKFQSLVESFIDTHGPEILEEGKHAKIFIYDELEFNNFYAKTKMYNPVINFLETIDADIFIPLYEKNNMIGYIIVERHVRSNSFYGDTERDEMLVYSSYLSNIISLLQTKNLNLILQQEKELKEELYHKNQEINQYKESIRSFIRTVKDKEIGIIFYKSRNFIFGNKAAKELIQINLNAQEGHPITKTLKNVARQVEEYKTAITQFTFDTEGKKIIISGMPNLDKNNVIITIYYPEISDIIKKQIELLKDPSMWDYLLYLETTESGKLINKLIPSSSETILQFKIELLKLALTKKSLLLEMPDDDIIPTVEIIHHISLRETLHRLKLHGPVQSNETIIKLFGINPILGIKQPEQALLEQLDETGTLFIENVHLLDLESQEHLAEFLQYGLYRLYKSDQKVPSTARVICSTNQNLQTCIQDGTFSKNLFAVLKQTALHLPSLLSLPEQELSLLVDGFAEQIIQSQPLKSLLELTPTEKSQIAHNRPVSLHELKNKVQLLLTNRSKKNQIYDETKFDPAYQLTDPQLIEAARLGKHALKDPRIMTILWNKFKSQAKIATFLGVNRSSINRRCKDYNLL